jgi:hypothetical protein
MVWASDDPLSIHKSERLCGVRSGQDLSCSLNPSRPGRSPGAGARFFPISGSVCVGLSSRCEESTDFESGHGTPSTLSWGPVGRVTRVGKSPFTMCSPLEIVLVSTSMARSGWPRSTIHFAATSS